MESHSDPYTEPNTEYLSSKPKKANYNLICEPTEDLGGLFLGNVQAVEDLQFFRDHSIKAILDVAGYKAKHAKEYILSSKSIDADDTPDFQITTIFDECFDFIHKNRAKGYGVYVHCRAGVSRSATIVIGYLMKTLDMDLKSAHMFVKGRRWCIAPNSGFMQQLMMHEAKLFRIEYVEPANQNTKSMSKKEKKRNKKH